MFSFNRQITMIVCLVLVAVVVALLVFIKFLLADGDLTLLLAEKLGKNLKALECKVVWITGASSGIGEHLAYELAKYNCRLILSSRNKEALENVKSQCLAIGELNDEDILVLPLDVTNFSHHEECVKRIYGHFAKIDILINNAGRSQRALIADTSIDVDRDMLELNALAPISITKKVLPHMLERDSGHIVIISSLAGKIGLPNSASYCLSKFAVEGWYQSLKAEVANKNIDITIVCPGPVKSNIIENSFTGTSGKTFGSSVTKDFKRMPTERCAELISVAIANKLSEVWISQQPALTLAYITRIWPTFLPWFTKHFGSVLNQLRNGKP